MLDLVKDKHKRYQNKRLTNVIKSVVTSSRFKCLTLCSRTDGCLAVNVLGERDITCELTAGLSSEIEMQLNASSRFFVMSK